MPKLVHACTYILICVVLFVLCHCRPAAYSTWTDSMSSEQNLFYIPCETYTWCLVHHELGMYANAMSNCIYTNLLKLIHFILFFYIWVYFISAENKNLSIQSSVLKTFPLPLNYLNLPLYHPLLKNNWVTLGHTHKR